MRIGAGYDSHRLVEGRKLIIGGVDIPFEKGLAGHSDGDVLAHAIIDAIIGALGLGDIGKHFPDTDETYRGISSILLLRHAIKLADANGYRILWVDCTVIAERPRLAPYMEAMKEALAGAGLSAVNIKAKTNEGMGFIGRGEGIAAQAACLLGRL